MINTINEILKTEKKITVKDNVKITVNQNKIIQAIKENPFITQEELVQIVGISKVNINKNMKNFKKMDVFKELALIKTENGNF